MDILNLINDYISCSRYMCGNLRHHFNIPIEISLLMARKTYNLLPKEGILPDRIYYNFHGIGCYFEFEGGSIDVDFGPNDRCDGFDFHRIKDFLLSTKLNIYKKLIDENVLKYEFENCISDGTIFKPTEWHGSLYYLKK